MRDFISQNDILTRMGITDPDERLILINNSLIYLLLTGL